ncbi:MAG TPA: class I SAM-dependent methyltransferase [Usitatibacter sp.]|nr:class I SAM-dependent methyltransferase [Usitatibacter sp.]
MIRSLSRLFLHAIGKPPAPIGFEARDATFRDAANDPWFWSHYRDAAGIVLSLVPASCFAKDNTVVDFGCGDGATSLGIASRVAARVVGVDLHTSYSSLPDMARRNLRMERLPANLAFEQVAPGAPLPFRDGAVDLVYSWSVFEHLADVDGTLAEMSRIVRSGGRMFIQIEPLYHGPFGSHLQRLVREPWAHLLHDEEEFLRMAASAHDRVAENEKDVLYRTHAFEDVKRHLLKEYRSLNRITGDRLLARVSSAGFRIEESRLIQVENLRPDPRLLEKYPLETLLTNQVVLTAIRE